MVRNRVRKTTIRQHSAQNMQEAIELVESGFSLRDAALRKQVNYMTLSRYVKKMKNKPKEERRNITLTPNYANRKVFSKNQETGLKEYIITCSKMSYGLDTVECRKLACEMAVFHELKMPASWIEKKIAGIDWLYGFRQRNPDLSLRKPEPCSLSRATSFNRHNVNMFFDNLQEAMSRSSSFLDGTRIFCLDETGTTTVQKPKKILAQKGTKQLNKVVSAERGTLVTTCCAVSATGSALPPAMVFPRKVFKPFMVKGSPLGTLGLTQSTGWSTGELFAEVIKHFIKVTSSTKENPSLLILDNHESHLAPAVLNIAKDNGVTLLTIPPHTSNKLQPLDVSIFGPFQTFYNAAVDSWMMRHPGRTIGIYDVGGLVGQAFDRAMTPVNIKAGFKKTGIFPFDRHIFTDDDFMPSEITNRPAQRSDSTNAVDHQMEPSDALKLKVSSEPSTTTSLKKSLASAPGSSKDSASHQDFPEPQLDGPSRTPFDDGRLNQISPSILLHTMDPKEAKAHEIFVNEQSSESQQLSLMSHSTPVKDSQLKSPIGCREYPKAGPRLESNKGRKRGRSLIATDTPIKKEFEEAALKRTKPKKTTKKSLTAKNNTFEVKEYIKTQNKQRAKRVIFDDSDDTMSISSGDSGDLPLSYLKKPERGDFVIVKFAGKQQKVKHYIGKLLTDNEDDAYDVSFLRKSSKVDNNFYFPLEPDMATVGLEDIEAVLPLLENKKITKRQADSFVFPKNILKKYNLQ